jgi:hypothetical protein
MCCDLLCCEQVSGLSDREKRAQAAELRLLAMVTAYPPPPPPLRFTRSHSFAAPHCTPQKGSGAKCDHCSKPLVRVPFERLNFKYCTITCLQAHKAKTEGDAAAKLI